MASSWRWRCAAALIGFAPFNRPVARIFLGDVGSLPIGLLFAWLLVLLAGNGHLAAAVILPLYYLADATLTLLRRMANARAVLAGAPHAFLSARDRPRLQRCRDRRPRVRRQPGAGRARRRERAVAGPLERGGRARLRRCAGRLAAVALRARQIVTRILVTGASGFVGRALVAELAERRTSGARGDAPAGRRVSALGRGGGGVRPDPPGRMARAAQGRRDGGSSRRHRARRPGHRRGGLRPGQSPGDRRTGQRRASRRHPPSRLHLVDPRPERARRPPTSCARPMRRTRPTPTAAPSSPPRRPCAPPACRSRSCGRC